MGLIIKYRPTDETSAREFLQWKYDRPYEIYNYNPEYFEEDLDYHLDPSNNIFSMFHNEELIGYCSFGQDARVRGGNYSEDALDIGLMIKPMHTGQGKGSEYVRDVVEFATSEYSSKKLRVTIMARNTRATRVWEKIGFQKTQAFVWEMDQLPLIVLTRDA